MNFEFFFNNLPELTITGLAFGSIYALIALGYTMVYGVLQLINFAHSEVFMYGTFAMLWTVMAFNAGEANGAKLIAILIASLIAAMVVSAIIALILERGRLPTAHQPQRAAPGGADLRDRCLVRARRADGSSRPHRRLGGARRQLLRIRRQGPHQQQHGRRARQAALQHW
ncbi:ABC transporter permease subunit [Nocardioides sp. B-3]|uniref:ABC transporter permease subunit n=1 Tax=Nocardioides sp. B-3 TaxID=2895565 RepID=UPI002152C602|nr:hypothetical protein [Nocardioides sp. B-3]